MNIRFFDIVEDVKENRKQDVEFVNELEYHFDVEDKWLWEYIMTMHGYLSPDSVFIDFNVYDEEELKRILTDILSDECGFYFTDYKYEINFDN